MTPSWRIHPCAWADGWGFPMWRFSTHYVKGELLIYNSIQYWNSLSQSNLKINKKRKPSCYEDWKWVVSVPTRIFQISDFTIKNKYSKNQFDNRFSKRMITLNTYLATRINFCICSQQLCVLLSKSVVDTYIPLQFILFVVELQDWHFRCCDRNQVAQQTRLF
jgi:hypothetical protein